MAFINNASDAVLLKGKKASLAKLHMLNDAMRVNKSKDHLNKLLVEEQEVYSWSIRIEPAFARALDFWFQKDLPTGASQMIARQLS